MFQRLKSIEHSSILNFVRSKKRTITALSLASLSAATLAIATGIAPVKIAGVSNVEKADAAWAYNGTLYAGQNVCIRIDNKYTDFEGSFNNGSRYFVGAINPANGTNQPSLPSRTPIALGVYVAQVYYNWAFGIGWNNRAKYVNLIYESGSPMTGVV
jgi:hypothetical protein